MQKKTRQNLADGGPGMCPLLRAFTPVPRADETCFLCLGGQLLLKARGGMQLGCNCLPQLSQRWWNAFSTALQAEGKSMPLTLVHVCLSKAIIYCR